MPVDIQKIHIGRGEIWVGGTAPLAGTDLTDPTLGTPSALNAMTVGFAAPVSGGTYVGATQGAATLTYRPTYYLVEIEQAFAEVVTVPTSEEAMLAFTAEEHTYANIQHAFGQTVTRVVGSGVLSNTNYVGGKTVLNTKVVALASRKRSGVGYFMTTLYQAYSNEGSTVNYERRVETKLPVTMRALADPARPEGDQLFQIVEYPANPV